MDGDGGRLYGAVGDSGAWWGTAAATRVIFHDALKKFFRGYKVSFQLPYFNKFTIKFWKPNAPVAIFPQVKWPVCYKAVLP